MKRIFHGLVWGAVVAILILAGYLFFWTIDVPDQSFLRWSTEYLKTVHPLQVVQLGFPVGLARSAMGLSGAIVHDEALQDLLSAGFSTNQIFVLYGSFGLVVLAAILAFAHWKGLGEPLWELMRRNSLFAVSLLSMLAWWAFALAWQPATPYYWVLSFFPALLCLGMLIRKLRWRPGWAFVMAIVVLTAWNGYFDHYYDLLSARGFPDPLLASIQEHVGSRDIFIVLGLDNIQEGVDYELLSWCLKYGPRNPEVAIFDDFVIPAEGSQSWRDKLRQKIDSTLDSGGRVFVAEHVFDPDSYEDLSAKNDAFNQQIYTQYLKVDSKGAFEQIHELFSHYHMAGSDFSLGDDDYLVIEHR
jgi:hypothetical protein